MSQDAFPQGAQEDTLQFILAPCRLDEIGECEWSECPQRRDNEPSATGRRCPLQPPTARLQLLRKMLRGIDGALLSERDRRWAAGNKEAALALDSARHGISCALQDIRQAETRITEAANAE